MSGGEDTDDPVGYGKPPVKHQYKKGQSGNPKGRPRKARVVRAPSNRLLGSDQPTTTAILEEGYRMVRVSQGDRIVEMPANRAIIRAMQQNALRGNRVAQRDYTILLRSIENEQKEAQLEYFKTFVIYKENAEREIARCQERGIDPPEMVPHPNDIFIDPKHGTAEVRGPFSPYEKKQWDMLLARRDEAAKEVKRASRRHRMIRDPELKEMLLRDWLHEQKLFDIINDRLPRHYQTVLANRSDSEGASQPGDYADGKRAKW